MVALSSLAGAFAICNAAIDLGADCAEQLLIIR
jgi:hypothetical protein